MQRTNVFAGNISSSVPTFVSVSSVNKIACADVQPPGGHVAGLKLFVSAITEKLPSMRPLKYLPCDNHANFVKECQEEVWKFMPVIEFKVKLNKVETI